MVGAAAKGVVENVVELSVLAVETTRTVTRT